MDTSMYSTIQTTRRGFLRCSGEALAATMLSASVLQAAGEPLASDASAPKAARMKIAMMTYTFARQGWRKDGQFDLAGMCKVGQELGIDGVDIVSHSFSPLEPSLIRRVVGDHGQKVVCYTFFPKLSKSTAEERAPGMEEVKKGVEVAHALGADKIMIHTPGDSSMPGDVCRTNWIHGLREAMLLARDAGLTLAIESIPGSPLAKSSEMLYAIGEIPGLKAVFDQGNIYASGEDPLVFYMACKDHVVHVHFKDGRWREETTSDGKKKRHYENELIGEGVIDHAGLLRAMKDAGYCGHIDIEYEGDKYRPDVATRKATVYLRDKMTCLE